MMITVCSVVGAVILGTIFACRLVRGGVYR